MDSLTLPRDGVEEQWSGQMICFWVTPKLNPMAAQKRQPYFLGRWHVCSKDALVLFYSIGDSFIALCVLGRVQFSQGLGVRVRCVFGFQKQLFHHHRINDTDCEGLLQRPNLFFVMVLVLCET